jgi:hypothetical protein
LLGPGDDTDLPHDDGVDGLVPPPVHGESQVRDRWQPYRDGYADREPARLRPIPQPPRQTDWIYDDPAPEPTAAVQNVTRRQRLPDDGWTAR